MGSGKFGWELGWCSVSQHLDCSALGHNMKRELEDWVPFEALADVENAREWVHCSAGLHQKGFVDECILAQLDSFRFDDVRNQRMSERDAFDVHEA